MRSLKLKGKLTLVIAILVATSALIGFTSVSRMARINDILSYVVNFSINEISDGDEVQIALLDAIRAEKNAVLSTTDADSKKFTEDAQVAIANVEKAYQALVKTFKEDVQASNAERDAVAAFARPWEEFKKNDKTICDLAMQNSESKATALSSGKALEESEKMNAALESLAGEARKNFDAASKSNDIRQMTASLEKMELARQAIIAGLAMHRLHSSQINAKDEKEIELFGQQLKDTESKVQAALGRLSDLAGEREKAKLAPALTAWQEFQKITAEVQRLSRLNTNTLCANLSLGAQRDVHISLNKILEAINDAVDKSNEEQKQIGITTYKNARLMLLLVSLAGTAIALTIATILIVGLTRSLTRAIAQLNTASEQVGSGAGQVAQSSQAMAAGASEQAGSLEEISSSLEEMSSMTKQNADNARNANDKAGQAREAAMKGREAMVRMSEAIAEIKSSSDQTAKIVKTIDEIAFQTNLLALNAAVEAARAGDAGKGFAVVAEEVRNLAQRSAEAAKNTAALIEASQKNADNGVGVSGEVETTLKQIAEGIQQVDELVAEVASASTQQAQGIEQINTAVAQLDKVTQSNAANAEESASASEELSAQAKELGDIVGVLVGIVGESA